MTDKVVLAYSGGLDTSVAIKWIKDKYGYDVIAVTIDVGNEKDFSAVREKALKVGAVKALVIDAKKAFVTDYLFPVLKAGSLYEGVYPWRPPSPARLWPNSWPRWPWPKGLLP